MGSIRLDSDDVQGIYYNDDRSLEQSKKGKTRKIQVKSRKVET